MMKHQMCFGDEELMSVQYLGLPLKGGGVGVLPASVI